MVQGRRVTDAAAIDATSMVLNGLVNTRLLALCREFGIAAIGLSGVDGGLVKAHRRAPVTLASGEVVDYGMVGDIDGVDGTVITRLLDAGFLPVVSPLSCDASGHLLNINADTVAGAIAEAIGAEKLVYLTDIEGLRRDVADASSLIRQATAEELDELVAEGIIAGGMIPKVDSCTHAVRNGVHRAHILDGRIAHVLLLEIFTDAGIGTMVMHHRHDQPTDEPPEGPHE